MKLLESLKYGSKWKSLRNWEIFEFLRLFNSMPWLIMVVRKKWRQLSFQLTNQFSKFLLIYIWTNLFKKLLTVGYPVVKCAQTKFYQKRYSLISNWLWQIPVWFKMVIFVTGKYVSFSDQKCCSLMCIYHTFSFIKLEHSCIIVNIDIINVILLDPTEHYFS